MKNKTKTLLIISVLTMLSIATYSFIIPTTFKNKCNDKNIFEYKFGIYKIDTLYDNEIEYKKISGISEYLNFNKPKCLEEIENEDYLRIKEINDSVNKSLNWEKLKCGLFVNKNGELGFEDQRALNEGMISETYYLTKFGFDKNPTLKSIVDTATFRELGNTHYKDKNHIYHYYGMAHGGQFYIFDEVDYPTFEILGDCYAKDKNNIYEMRAGKLDSIDYKTFRTVKNCGCFAKDKNGYYNWDSTYFFGDDFYNFDSEGNSFPVSSRKWTELYMKSRQNKNLWFDIGWINNENKSILEVTSDKIENVNIIAYFLAKETKGEIFDDTDKPISLDILKNKMGNFDLNARLLLAEESIWRKSSETNQYPNLEDRKKQ